MTNPKVKGDLGGVGSALFGLFSGDIGKKSTWGGNPGSSSPSPEVEEFLDPQIAAQRDRAAAERIEGYKEGADAPFRGPWGSGQFTPGGESSTAINPEWQQDGFFLPDDEAPYSSGRIDDLLDLL